MVDDVTPYELMKLRLLNASHQSLCYFAYLAGYRLVHDAAGDPLFAEFLRQYMDSEATPTLLPVPGIDLPDYKRTLIERFANPGVRDTIARLCFGSSDRIPKWLLARHPGEPRHRCAGSAVGGDGRELGALRRGRRRAGRADRGRRTNSPTPLSRLPSRSARTRPRSSRTRRCSAISRTQSAVRRRPTCGRSTPCIAMAHAPRWRSCSRQSMTGSRTGHRRGADRHRRARRRGPRRARRRQSAERRGRLDAGSVAMSTSSPTSAMTHDGRRIADYVEGAGVQLVSGSTAAAAPRRHLPSWTTAVRRHTSSTSTGSFRVRREVGPPIVAHTGSIAAFLEPGCRATAALLDTYRPSATITFDPNVRPGLIDDHAAAVGRIEPARRTGRRRQGQRRRPAVDRPQTARRRRSRGRGRATARRSWR